MRRAQRRRARPSEQRSDSDHFQTQARCRLAASASLLQLMLLRNGPVRTRKAVDGCEPDNDLHDLIDGLDLRRRSQRDLAEGVASGASALPARTTALRTWRRAQLASGSFERALDAVRSERPGVDNTTTESIWLAVMQRCPTGDS